MPPRPPDPAVVDAVIVTWNSGPDLPACLAALPSFVRPIVVDNGSADDGVAIARATGIDVVVLGENRGFPAAVNVGLERVTSDFTLLLNPDLVVGEGAVERCLDVLAHDSSIGLVGPNTVDSDGRPEPPAARKDRRAGHILLESLALTRLHPWFDRQTIRDRSADRDVDAVNGAFMLVRTDLLRSLGGLDETVFMYLEDADLCRRVRDSGYRVRFVAGATAVHAGATSTSRGDTEAQARAYLHRLDADIELLRRYGRRGEAGVGVAAYLLRSVVGLVVSTRMKDRRQRYASALRWTWSQRRGRMQPPKV
jgi:GT2 family glycosyltransferase